MVPNGASPFWLAVDDRPASLPRLTLAAGSSAKPGRGDAVAIAGLRLPASRSAGDRSWDGDVLCDASPVGGLSCLAGGDERDQEHGPCWVPCSSRGMRAGLHGVLWISKLTAWNSCHRGARPGSRLGSASGVAPGRFGKNERRMYSR